MLFWIKTHYLIKQDEYHNVFSGETGNSLVLFSVFRKYLVFSRPETVTILRAVVLHQDLKIIAEIGPPGQKMLDAGVDSSNFAQPIIYLT